MHNNCLHCGAHFKGKRATRKYCSDNCKQLAYFKRKGIVWGVNGVKPIQDNIKHFTIEPNTNETIKTNYVDPDNAKQSENTLREEAKPETIKQGLKENAVSLPSLSEQQLQELVYRISTSFDVKIQKAIADVKKELDVKFASLYGSEAFTQKTQTEIISCASFPFTGITKQQNDLSIKQEDQITVKPDVKNESEALTQSSEKTPTENNNHFTLNDKALEPPKTLPYLELTDDADDDEQYDNENEESEDESEENNNELYDITSEKTETQTDNTNHFTKNVSEDETEKDRYIKELEEKLRALTFQSEQKQISTKETETMPVFNNEEQTESEQQEKQEENQTQKPTVQKVETPPEYEWVQSKFLKVVEKDFEESNGQDFFDDEDPDVDWVNERLRCIAENVIRLSEHNAIDRESILRLNNALNKIISSSSFNNLPSDYPYSKLTLEITERLNTLATNKSENISLRINFKAKAKLVSMIYQMKENVPLLKFNELDFSEAHSEKNQPVLSGTGKKKNKKPRSWRVLYNEHVQAGRIVA